MLFLCFCRLYFGIQLLNLLLIISKLRNFGRVSIYKESVTYIKIFNMPNYDDKMSFNNVLVAYQGFPMGRSQGESFLLVHLKIIKVCLSEYPSLYCPPIYISVRETAKKFFF